MISIKSFGKARKSGGSSSASGGYANSATNVINKVDGVNIWGQYHDHKADVSGDMSGVGNINSDGTITAYEGYFSGDGGFGGVLSCGNLEANTADITTVGATTVNSSTINNGGTITTNTLNGTNATVTNMTATNGDVNNLNVRDLTVSGTAHFFELMIDKVKSAGGQVILSAANAKIDIVRRMGDYWVLLWKKTDDEGRAVANEFKADDQVLCQTFNKQLASDYNVNNKMYWMLCAAAGEDSTEVVSDIEGYNYIVLNDNIKSGNGTPEAGDEVALLGYRGSDNDAAARQSAIILSAYKSPDTNVTAPSIVQYTGINSFSLNGCILNQMSPDGNVFNGDFMVTSGGTTTNIINLINGGKLPTIVCDNEASWLMADSNGYIYSLSDAQSLPTTIQVYDGDDVVPYANWDSASYIKYRGVTTRLKSNLNPMTTNVGLYISAYTAGTNNVTLTWGYNTANSYQPTNSDIEVYVKYTANGNTKEVRKKIPASVIKAGSSTVGADAEFDKLMVENADFTVTLQNNLSVAFMARVQHVKGNAVTTLTNLNDYTCDMVFSNGSVLSANRSTYFYYANAAYINDFSQLTTKPTSVQIRLFYNTTLVDSQVVAIKFDAGSVFTVKDNAITAAVQQSNDYTDGEIATVNSDIARVELKADNVTSTVTNIQNDYVTSSQLSQTSNNIALNVYDTLKNRTGIDITNGRITLNADNTVINGLLQLFSNNGIIVNDSDGTPRITLTPNTIGTINDYDGDSTYYVNQTLSGNSFNLTTEKVRIGQFNAGDTITINNYLSKVYALTANLQVITPDTATTTSTVKLYREGNNNAIQTWTITQSKNGSSVEYTDNTNLTYNVGTSAVYLLQATVTNTYTNAAADTYYIQTFFTVNQRISHQTIVGKDGMFCTPQQDEMFWVNADEIRLKYNNSGIRLNDDGLQVQAGLKGSYPNLKPQWVSVHNYTPMFTISQKGGFTYGTVAAVNQQHYNYQLDAVNDIGNCIVTAPAYNGSMVKQESWVILPPAIYTDGDGDSVALPIGYTITIINQTLSPDNVAVKVCGADSNTVIVDSNRNTNTVVDLSGAHNGMCNDTFIYTGQLSGINYWRQLHDTQ